MMQKTRRILPAGKRKVPRELRRNGVQSIEVGSQLLEVLAANSGPMNLKDIAAGAGLSPSRAHRYLASLIRVGLAEQAFASGRYDLGETALRVGLAALNRRSVLRHATEAAVELNQAEDLTVNLTIWAERGPVIVGWYDSSEILICNLNVGSVLPLLRSANGQVFLAYLPRRTTQQMVHAELRNVIRCFPHARFKTMDDVDRLTEKVRRLRVGSTNEDLVPGLGAFAAPIFDHEGRIAASISVVVPLGVVKSAGSGSIAKKVLATADRVSLKLGWQSASPGSSFVERSELRRRN